MNHDEPISDTVSVHRISAVLKTAPTMYTLVFTYSIFTHRTPSVSVFDFSLGALRVADDIVLTESVLSIPVIR